MARDELTGNMPTENLVAYFNEVGEDIGLDADAFKTAMEMVPEIFPDGQSSSW